MMLISVVVIGLVLYYMFRETENAPSFYKKDPNEMLKERFVKGEIDEQTYLQMKETLKK